MPTPHAGDDRLIARHHWLAQVGGIRQWSQAGLRAPHKPLLIFYALGRLQQLGTSTSTFAEAEPKLVELLTDFGPPRSTSPAYPFRRLVNDGLWTVQVAGEDPGESRSRLRESGATGAFTPGFERALTADPGLASLVARSLLDANFAASLHGDICAAAGLDVERLEGQATQDRLKEIRRRDPVFRREVLVAYEYRCAMCGYDGRLGTEAVGLDAAHIRWWAFDGPDTVANGLCLCSFHHKLLDRGVLGIDPDHAVTVSEHFVGRGRAARALVFDLLGSPLHEPQRGKPSPDRDHISWHTDQVFRSPSRVPA